MGRKKVLTPEFMRLEESKELLGYQNIANFMDWCRANDWTLRAGDASNPIPATFEELFARFAGVSLLSARLESSDEEE